MAVFLEELETGAIECHAWDVAGEEYLEFTWEPVGSTTRDYLDNPRLIPEDSPTPSVIAPETPVHETLESFRSGETTFHYRYRLTAVSRATGLSSSSEVEVFVSSSRPSVYCPLEIVVEEGETVQLDCEGADPLSARMDYDEEAMSIWWEWEGLWGTSTAPLDATDLSSPLFTAPAGSAGEEYHYIASMTTSASGVSHTARRRVTVRVVGEEDAEQALVLASKANAPSVTCEDAEIYEATEDFTLDCSVTDEPSDAEYAWAARGSTSGTSELSSTTVPTPTFYVPNDIPGPRSPANDHNYKKHYRYRLTMYSANVSVDSADVTVTVLEKPNIRCSGSHAISEGWTAIERTRSGHIGPCSESQLLPARIPRNKLVYSWTGTPDTKRLSATNVLRPWFSTPNVSSNVVYNLKLEVSAPGENADTYSYRYFITVKDRPDIRVSCEYDNPVYEGSEDIAFDCSASGGSSYAYAWSSPGAPADTSLLSATDISSPTFDVPLDVDADTDYEYTLKVSGNNADDGTEEVTVTVKDRAPSAPVVTCADPDEVYEGSSDFALDCSVANEPPGATYSWTPRGDTPDTDALSNTDSLRATFSVPDNVDADTDYKYTVTLSASGIDDVDEEVTVMVKNKPDITVTCTDNPYEAEEGDDDIELECEASGAPGDDPDYIWSWSPTTHLTDHNTATPTFAVPDVDQDTTYTYTAMATAANAEDDTAEVTVTVSDTDASASIELEVLCDYKEEVYAGDPDVGINCRVAMENPLNGYNDWTWGWVHCPSGADCPETGGKLIRYDNTSRRLVLSGITPPRLVLNWPDENPHPVHYATFKVPEVVEAAEEIWRYRVYGWGRSWFGTAYVDDPNKYRSTIITIRVVRNPNDIVVSCTDPGEVYEGSSDFALDCTVTNEPSGATYSWTGTDIANRLSGADGPTPTFNVPGSVNANTEYDYTVTLSASGIDDVTEDVTVTVLNKPSITARCLGNRYDVDEGSEDFVMSCVATGAPGENPEYTYAWTVRGDTPDTALALLSGRDIAAPTFYVPGEVESDQIYQYLVTVSAENAVDGLVEVTVTVRDTDSTSPVITCSDSEIYEAAADFTLDCTVTNEPSGATYSWSGTDIANRLSGTVGLTPTFNVPGSVNANTEYDYTVTLSASGIDDVTEDVTVTVLDRGALAVVCTDPDPVHEGSDDIVLDCSASGAPAGSDYEYEWAARGSTANTDRLSATDIPSPTFYVPEELDATTTYEYLLTVSAENAEDASARVTVTVLNRGALAVVCADPGSVYEDSADIAFDCEASGAPAGSDYAYAWTARGDTQDTALLSATDIASPTFHVPEEVDEDETYEYLLTARAANAEDATAEVTVTVLNKGALALVCADPGSVYEGSEDITFDCSASGAPGDSPQYTYVWTVRGDTQDTALLSATDIASPTFHVPEEVNEDETYEYLLTVSAANAEDATAEVTVTVLNKGALALVCADPGSVYEGSSDIVFDCSASGAPGDNPQYTYVWTARGDTPDVSLLSAADIASPTFHVPEEVDEDETYEYLLTARAANAEDATAEVTVTVLNKGALALVCADPGSVYEGSSDIVFDCSASGAPGDNPQYTYVWTARGDTPDVSLLSAADIASPTFHVPEEVDEDETYEYLLTARAANAEDATAEVTVTVLNKGALALVCADPGSVYEGSEDITFDCSASGAPGDNPQYTYVWTVRGDTQDTALLSATDIASPTFHVPEEVDEDETYEYLLTARATNAEDATAEVTVTVLDRIQTPDPDPVSPPMASSSSAREPSDPSALGVTVSASPLRFGVQSADTQASLDPVTDGISTHVSGPYHVGRMTLSPSGSEALDENREMDLSIELTSPVLLKRADAVETSSLVLEPAWSLAESCEQLSSQAIESLYTEVTLSEEACRLLHFGGELDLTDVPSGQYAGSMDIILRSGEREETHSVEVDVTVIPAQQVITIGPRGVRFSTSRELPAGLTEEQNLSIYPHVAFLTEEKPHGVFELSNPSLIPLEISVSARFGYTEATENGREVVVEDASGSHLGDLSQVVDIHPNVLVLQPGEKGLVRYGMQEGALAAMAEKGYAAFFDVVSEPRQYVRSDQMPEEVSGDRTARVTMRVPGVYVPGEGASQLRAALSSISYVGSMSATFLLETQDHPFVGEVVAYDGDGRELGRRETLVYTRSRVRIPLDRMPEAGTVFLRFSPRGSDRVPEPASVEWGAPRRDIGAAGKDRTRAPATLAQKP